MPMALLAWLVLTSLAAADSASTGHAVRFECSSDMSHQLPELERRLHAAWRKHKAEPASKGILLQSDASTADLALEEEEVPSWALSEQLTLIDAAASNHSRVGHKHESRGCDPDSDTPYLSGRVCVASCAPGQVPMSYGTWRVPTATKPAKLLRIVTHCALASSPSRHMPGQSEVEALMVKIKVQEAAVAELIKAP
eukprot:TRINITY_DN4016_c0_g1_i1.p1 TRINITY_DN4016_c0_g1~~TRINITY_DN4016_c0_g1_i1.p1  ORF type:complete len:196 (+),score=31.20 TRINITY_DN4016_c0_g1_i1:156-743(+)